MNSLSLAGAQARQAEGTTVIEIQNPSSDDRAAAQEAKISLIDTLPDDHPGPVDFRMEVAGWLLTPSQALSAHRAQIDGYRITVRYRDGNPVPVLDAISRSQAAFLRVGRSQIAEASKLTSLPGIQTRLSVFADVVEEAIEAVRSGATDLLLRDWDLDRLAELRLQIEAEGFLLEERTAYPPRMEVDRLRDQLPSTQFSVWLEGVDGSGRARPRYQWAPGKDLPPPFTADRLSAQWSDQAWVTSRPPDELAAAGPLIPILERSLSGHAPSVAEVEQLFGAAGNQVEAIAFTADKLREERVGERVSYVVNRNINYTNLCYFRCGFCAFSKGPKSLNLRGDPYLMSIPEIVDRAREAWHRGATEVTLQGGIHPEFTGGFYQQVVEAIKAELPEMHIHGFTPLEVWQGAETIGIEIEEFLSRLQEAGLGSLPGTAAEILDDRVRRHLCPDKITTSEWTFVMRIAHQLGIPATATIMFGHIDHPQAWANHLEVIRSIQSETGGFTELVPLPFVYMGAPIYLRGRSRPGPTWDEVVLVHAVSRIALDGLIPNIQASWVKLGLSGGARLLAAGCNDLGGTLMGEIITRSAGANHGQEVSVFDFRQTITKLDREPVQRDTLYRPIESRAKASLAVSV